ncbi:SpoIIE family protein phosphatase [Radiobacillus kanasensis]|uniref:SpoIIE family protein phosphatase n=1 Tax=Radiobacillus kanasensis TaxID=2844358 RepID=UPI001E5D89EF|nr:SpoIIE family protein phosphatase [Radiobacillus kanasensis]UFT99829.1 SpoIIE family protein phosphatase [Radiobacillus kanasensis]
MKVRKHMDVSIFQQAKKGNYYCGDSYYYKETEDGFVCALADGLGSGEFAKESSQAVIQAIEQNKDVSLDQLIKICNKELTGKRGVVLGILKVDYLSHTFSFTSIGNVGVMTVTSSGVKKRSIPNSGYLAGFPRPFKVTEGQLEEDLVFILFTDGVNDRDLSSSYFMVKDVQRITETYRSVCGTNEKDDTTLIAIKYTE